MFDWDVVSEANKIGHSFLTFHDAFLSLSFFCHVVLCCVVAAADA